MRITQNVTRPKAEQSQVWDHTDIVVVKTTFDSYQKPVDNATMNIVTLSQSCRTTFHSRNVRHHPLPFLPNKMPASKRKYL